MAYSLETYLKIGNTIELEKRFKLLEPLLRIELKRFESIRRAMEDPEWGKAKLAEIQLEIDDLKQDMENIAIAVEALRGGFDD